MSDVTAAAKAELAPGGTLRAGINLANKLLTAKDASGKPIGVAVDLAHELGRRLGIPVEIVSYPTPGDLADSVGTGNWDIGFLGAEPQRANQIAFTPAYVEIEATYLVGPDSALRSIEDVDRDGVRIVVPAKAAYELYLSRSLKQAKLILAEGADNAFKQFVAEKLDALAGLKPRLEQDRDKLPGSRLIDGRFTAVQQAIGTPKARTAGAAYLNGFVADIKSSGLVAKLIAKHGVQGLSIAA